MDNYFSINMSIYFQTCKEAVGDLMKNMETVREIARGDDQWLIFNTCTK